MSLRQTTSVACPDRRLNKLGTIFLQKFVLVEAYTVSLRREVGGAQSGESGAKRYYAKGRGGPCTLHPHRPLLELLDFGVAQPSRHSLFQSLLRPVAV